MSLHLLSLPESPSAGRAGIGAISYAVGPAVLAALDESEGALTGTVGELGISPRHAPLITVLKPGPVRVQRPDGDEAFFFVGGGILAGVLGLTIASILGPDSTFGDELLKAVADCLSRSFLRKSDFVARYGGEEFIAILPGTSLVGARRCAEPGPGRGRRSGGGRRRRARAGRAGIAWVPSAFREYRTMCRCGDS